MLTRGVQVICSTALAPGFRLAGVPTLAVPNAEAAGAWLARASHRPEVGVILIESALFERLAAETVRELEREPLPLVIPFPSPAWEVREAPEAFLVALLQTAVGYRVRLP